ncbi:MAG: acyl-CoA thioesterase [Xanthomonadaceae bacterium]|nr:acyl-CoA thioesterase [Xanthomonadaceae bacterium]
MTPSQPTRPRQTDADPAARDAVDPSAAAHGAPLFVASLSVRWRDLDAFNHVNNSTYLTYIEEARLLWLQQLNDWMSGESAPILAASELNYRKPIVWPASLHVQLRCERLGNSSITLSHRIVDAADAACVYCDGRTVLVWINPRLGKPVPLPPTVRAAAAGTPDH